MNTDIDVLEALDTIYPTLSEKKVAILVADDSVQNKQFLSLIKEIYEKQKTSSLFVIQTGVREIPVTHFISNEELRNQLLVEPIEIGITKFLDYIDHSEELSEYDFFILFGVPEEDKDFYEPRDNIAVFSK